MEQILRHTDKWIQGTGPAEEVVVSSRARYARNLADYFFLSRGNAEHLEKVTQEISEAIVNHPYFKEFIRINVSDISKVERACLLESRLISAEVEKGHKFQMVYLNSQMNCSIMVNEEDHLRLQAVLPGLQINETLRLADQLDDALGDNIHYAFSGRFGFLTACPSNTGTGLRVSVMLHLPGLALKQKIEDLLKMIQPFG